MDTVAVSRGHIYSFFCGTLAPLPSAGLLEELSNAQNAAFLELLCSLGDEQIRSGADEFRAFLVGAAPERIHALVSELAVERTTLLRSTGKNSLKAPYERLYRPKDEEAGVIPAVFACYRKAGLRPPDATQESPDFLLTELEFLSNLCRMQEQDPQLSELARAFFTEHVGSWVPLWCGRAASAARTGFYRGVLRMLEGFLALEADYLQ